MSDLTSPISTYDLLPGQSQSGLIDDNCLFLGNSNQIFVFEISTSLTEPLKQLTSSKTRSVIFKMIKLGKNIILGEGEGYIQVFDIANLKITHTQQFGQISNIYDMIAIEDSEYLLLAGQWGLLKATKDQAIKHYFQGKWTLSICHIAESLYLVGLEKDCLIVWNEQSDQQLFKICQDQVFSIKRILTTNSYIIKAKRLQLLTIKNLEKSQFSLLDLLEAKAVNTNYTDSLQVSNVPNSRLVIATTHNSQYEKGKYERIILLMKINIADI